MKRQYTAADDSFRDWRKDPEYVAAFDALADEFAIASAFIKLSGDAVQTHSPRSRKD